ncbi:hypothetical protein Aab01nite_71580 [Paractinoplanes abujensis]|uniref:Uridine kinase n=1 Tax=Paractinoplanes abujensis TaxID=882441 RepID=A0A7W7G3N5_9ACTN|nr:hypothetical protein [Actinoplanes abujensis]MBB4694839.1 uridine kinase [Actinoplanes abujensis]GID23568.1 hypothetical protein Aab01nite_71580 [Actinoplanes abujensis]
MPEQSFRELAAYVLTRPPRLGRTRLIAVDGPSGAGKTRFAGQLATALACPVVHTDDLLDGWDDQFTFWTRLEQEVLAPLRAGEAATYRPYNWVKGDFSGTPVTVNAAEAVLLEGVSAARRDIRPELTLAVFVDAPARLRWDRAIVRDGDDSLAYRKYLGRWRAAEDRHFAVDETAAHADLIVDGATQAAEGTFSKGWAR